MAKRTASANAEMQEIREKMIEKSADLHESILRLGFVNDNNEADMLLCYSFDKFFSDVLQQVKN